MKKLYLLIFLLLIQSTLAITLENNQEQEYLGRTIKLDAVNEDKVILNVNGERNSLSVNQTKEFSGLRVTLTQIFYADQNSEVIVNAELAYICGDNTCNLGEEINCCTDCGCELFNEVCQENQCIVPECDTDLDCDDQNSLTIDSCEDYKCEYSSEKCTRDSDCDDNNPDTDDTCTQSKCQNIINYICKTDLDCDDGNPCTQDQCINKDCNNEEIENCNEEPLQMKKADPVQIETQEKQNFFSKFINFFKKLF